MASQYIQTQFIAAGLKPGGNNNSYVQRVPLSKGVVNSDESKFILTTGKSEQIFTYEKDFLLNPYFTRGSSQVSGPLVFAGFGVSAPELGYDDYKVIHVKDTAPTTIPVV